MLVDELHRIRSGAHLETCRRGNYIDLLPVAYFELQRLTALLLSLGLAAFPKD